MKDAERLRRLGQITVLLREKSSQKLHAAAQARQESLHSLAAIDAPTPAPDLAAIAAEKVALRYAVWVDQRRSKINRDLARQTADWHHALQEAAQAFGRDQVVQSLQKP